MEYQNHDGNKYLDGILSFMVFICAFEKKMMILLLFINLDALWSALKSFS